jgi:hypothetical protein
MIRTKENLYGDGYSTPPQSPHKRPTCDFRSASDGAQRVAKKIFLMRQPRKAPPWEPPLLLMLPEFLDRLRKSFAILLK